MQKEYFCSHCGYHQASTATWCAGGCGSDYNQMFAVPKRLITKLRDKSYEEGYWAYRDELKALLGTKDREDSFFVKSEIKRNLKGLNDGRR